MSATNSLADCFNPDHICEPWAAPEIFAHRVGYMEILPGDQLRCWYVLDLPSRNGVVVGSQVVCRLTCPLATALPGRTAVNLWLWRNGIVSPNVGPAPVNRTAH